MDKNGKYIVFRRGESETFFTIIFAPDEYHSDIAHIFTQNYKEYEAYSAGYVKKIESGELIAYGESSSLGLSVKDGDSELLNKLV